MMGNIKTRQANEHTRALNLKEWNICGAIIPKNEIVYFTQIFMIYGVIICSLVNICISENDYCLWSSLLSSCLGYLLPAPSIKSGETNFDSPDSAANPKLKSDPDCLPVTKACDAEEENCNLFAQET